MQLKFTNVLLFLIILIAVLLPSIDILSDWESLTYFTTFANKDASLDLFYPPRANVGGQGYFFLDLSRNLIEVFNLPINFLTLRLPSILFGMIALYIFYKISIRFSNNWQGLIVTFLLGTNPTFQFFQNSLTINMASFTLVLLLIYAILLLSEEKSNFNLVFTAITLSLVYTTYGPAKIFATITVIYVVFKDRIQRKFSLKNLLMLGAPSLILIIAQQYWNYENLKNLYLSKDAELLINQEKGEYFQSFLLNLKILVHTLFANGGSHHSSNIYSLMIGDRYPIINSLPMILLVCLGLFGLVFLPSAFNASSFSISHLIYLTGTLSALAVLMSATYETDMRYGKISFSTASNFRMMYLLIPIHLIIVFLLARYSHIWWQFTIYALIATSILIHCVALYKDADLVKAWIKSDTTKTATDQSIQDLDKLLDTTSGPIEGNLEHFLLQKKYVNWSTSVANQVGRLDKSSILIAKADIFCFSENPLIQKNYRNLNQLNFHSIFLLLYLSQEMGSSSTVSSVIKFSRDVSYIDGKYGIFPSKILAQNNNLLYEDKLGIYNFVKFGSNSKRDIFIVTSKEELLFVKQTLDSRELKFAELSPKFNCKNSYVPWYL